MYAQRPPIDHTIARFFRFLTRFATAAPLGFLVGLLAAVALPALMGWQSLTVMSGSMDPTIPTGSVVVVEQVQINEISPGDVITFRNPEDHSQLMTHRVRSITPDKGAVVVVTQGDANSGTETWSIATDGSVGLVRYHVPKLGYLLKAVHGPFARLAMVVVPALALCILTMIRIWRPRLQYLQLPSTDSAYALKRAAPQNMRTS